MDVTKPYKFIWFGDIHGPNPYESIGLRWALISQTPLVPDIGYVCLPLGSGSAGRGPDKSANAVKIELYNSKRTTWLHFAWLPSGSY